MITEQGLFENIQVIRLKPILKWAGGKSSLLPILLPLVPDEFNRYCEPFVGGGALFWALSLRKSVISDTNEELIHFYRAVRDHPEELFAEISSMKVNEGEYYSIRALEPKSLSEIFRAARFIYLNKTCYNGLYRVNRKGQFNTPYGKKDKGNIVEKRKLIWASHLLKQTEIVLEDYASTLELLNEGDFAYLDPPYVPVGKYSDFNRYTKNVFTFEDHKTLANEFRKASERGVKVLLSNSFNKRLLPLYEGFCIKEIQASRQINCKSTGRGKIKELLISNYPIE